MIKGLHTATAVVSSVGAFVFNNTNYTNTNTNLSSHIANELMQYGPCQHGKKTHLKYRALVVPQGVENDL